MTDLQTNEVEIMSAPTQLPTTAVHDPIEQRRRTFGRFLAPASTVSLVIPVRNEARNIAWVLEQIAPASETTTSSDGTPTSSEKNC